MYHRCGQRLFDLTLAVLALVLCAPVLLVVALLVRCKLGASVLFHQARLVLNQGGARTAGVSPSNHNRPALMPASEGPSASAE